MTHRHPVQSGKTLGRPYIFIWIIYLCIISLCYVVKEKTPFQSIGFQGHVLVIIVAGLLAAQALHFVCCSSRKAWKLYFEVFTYQAPCPLYLVRLG